MFLEEARTDGGTTIGTCPLCSRIALTLETSTSGFSMPSLRAADRYIVVCKNIFISLSLA